MFKNYEVLNAYIAGGLFLILLAIYLAAEIFSF